MKYHLNLGFWPGRDLGFFCRILEIFPPESRFLIGIYGFCRNLGFSPIGSGFSGFGGIEIETDPPESVSKGRKLAANRWNCQVGRFRISSSQILGVGRVSDRFGQA